MMSRLILFPLREYQLYAILLLEGGGDQEEDDQDEHDVDHARDVDRVSLIAFLVANSHRDSSLQLVRSARFTGRPGPDGPPDPTRPKLL